MSLDQAQPVPGKSTNEWAYNFRSRKCRQDSDDSDSASDNEDALPTSDNTELMNDLDLASRNETVDYKPNPWSIARINAASRLDRAVKKPVSRKTSINNSMATTRGPKGSIIDGFKRQEKRSKTKKSSISLKPDLPILPPAIPPQRPSKLLEPIATPSKALKMKIGPPSHATAYHEPVSAFASVTAPLPSSKTQTNLRISVNLDHAHDETYIPQKISQVPRDVFLPGMTNPTDSIPALTSKNFHSRPPVPNSQINTFFTARRPATSHIRNIHSLNKAHITGSLTSIRPPKYKFPPSFSSPVAVPKSAPFSARAAHSSPARPYFERDTASSHRPHTIDKNRHDIPISFPTLGSFGAHPARNVNPLQDYEHTPPDQMGLHHDNVLPPTYPNDCHPFQDYAHSPDNPTLDSSDVTHAADARSEARSVNIIPAWLSSTLPPPRPNDFEQYETTEDLRPSSPPAAENKATSKRPRVSDFPLATSKIRRLHQSERSPPPQKRRISPPARNVYSNKAFSPDPDAEWSTLPSNKPKRASVKKESSTFRLPILLGSRKPHTKATVVEPKRRVVTYLPPPRTKKSPSAIDQLPGSGPSPSRSEKSKHVLGSPFRYHRSEEVSVNVDLDGITQRYPQTRMLVNK